MESESGYKFIQENCVEPDHMEYKPHPLSVSLREVESYDCGNVFYFGGTFEPQDAESTRRLKQSLADYSNSTCFAFSANEDVEKIYQLIKTKGIKEITLAGYSQGTMRAVELANKFVPEDGVKINGLMLFEPTALHENKNLALNFLKEGPKTAWQLLKQPILDGLRGIKRGRENNLFGQGKNLAKEILKDGIPKILDKKDKSDHGLKKQIESMSSVQPNLEKIKCPIILVQGKKDKVSNHKLTKPENIFDQKTSVYHIRPERLGTHALQVLRSEQLAKVTLGLVTKQKKKDLVS